eukprot:CAMPEP_0118701394 /NCGR_PEP_ID=MMETSP0800-20121206/17226_1 /TAXON_ID=210618 ORGANISM="Striatella unipunctata, Strain CCMP2910" /NCGR_SAMPLE_ID=MMETSP0800 /ASSEMBLY_ACC=CAM_ASM_000638 /LENGTH=460 /DNA_ID=CAMNT_0006602309 /DNA_START=45 /DNA_END=1427 /DNA_ORIENTATION=-
MSDPTMEEVMAMLAETQDIEAKSTENSNSIDLFFVLTMGILCFLLQAGFGLLEVGSVRAKNAQNIMMKNLMDAAVSAIAYWLIGYGIAYGGTNSFIGDGIWALKPDLLTPEDYIYWYFNYVFAGTTATIVSGAVAERCQFRAYLVYSFALSGFIYPVASHWIWDGSGFLFGKVQDFAGGGAVHMVGGAAAAAGAFFLGPRSGKFVEDPDTGKKVPTTIPGHNAVLASLGALILWFGFFAFNGGSSYVISGSGNYDAVGRAVVVTTLGGAAGSFTLLIWGFYANGVWDLTYPINGLLAGMIGTCSGANVLDPWAAFILGILAAVGCQLQILLFENVLFIDDPLGASAVHYAGGMVGMIYAAFLKNPKYTGDTDPDLIGIFYGGNGKLLGYAFYGIIVYSAWAFGTSGVLFFSLNKIGWLRVSEEEEAEGMDLSHHGGKAYNMDEEDILESAPLKEEEAVIE